ncbi:hypothetical protein HJG60_011362 [Phyllostomus discolor]|uniref:Uncharacterized protein n=1 Tax=Phyllostomus discolor TaxID=89673 RepID=A0A834A4J6_9CHIR|nr:hypothetical protein HJG60_011362 [Phyllostomus discolor]
MPGRRSEQSYGMPGFVPVQRHGDPGPHCQLDYTLRWHWRLLTSVSHSSQTCHFLVALTPRCPHGQSDPALVHGRSAWTWSGSGTFSRVVLWQPQELSGCRVGRMPQWEGSEPALALGACFFLP